jgi:hypothetical protein
MIYRKTIKKEIITMSSATFIEHDTTHGARAGEYGEGSLAKMIEEQTAKLPSDLFCGPLADQ